MVTDALTPDFATYVWAPLTDVEVTGPFVVVRWSDGLEHRCYSIWLWEMSVAIDPVTREATVDPGDLPSPDVLADARRSEDGALVVEWQDGSTSTLHPGWLRAIATAQHLPAAAIGEAIEWRSDIGAPPSFDGAEVLHDDPVLSEWLTALCTYGAARLRNGPADRTFLSDLARRIGPIRGSNFGEVFTVEARPDADSTANTSLNLGQHADLPTRETPPGFQFLHCVANTVAGGGSRLTDGLAVVAVLQARHPAEYDALCTLEWVFANRAKDGDHRWIGPIIDHGTKRSPLTMRAFYPVRLAPYMPAADVPRAYAAMRVFSKVAHDPALMIINRFEPGDVIGFDNRRVLHGRDEFVAGGGERVLTGCYIDHDDVYSRLRVLRRDAADSASNSSSASPSTSPSTSQVLTP